MQAFSSRPWSQGLVNAQIAEVDFGAGNFTGFARYRALTVDSARMCPPPRLVWWERNRGFVPMTVVAEG
jgi:hypothetical protein